MFCRDAASARPEACRDKSKAPRSGDFAGRSPGVQGAAATGRPLYHRIHMAEHLPGAQSTLESHVKNAFPGLKSCKPISISTIFYISRILT
ncbi:oxidoreductase [Klebsiella variicola]|nr:oxidoreductase [Klebsiella variicola]PXL24071.1 oxidoreductase [Klebsiella variicola]PXL24424.1 oxidoreductase [Klebsiella variicola]